MILLLVVLAALLVGTRARLRNRAWAARLIGFTTWLFVDSFVVAATVLLLFPPGGAVGVVSPALLIVAVATVALSGTTAVLAYQSGRRLLG
jgi:hypothetical protein